MKCPVCDVNLLMAERLNVPIDYCPKCRGIRLEKGRLEQRLGSSGESGSPGKVQYAGKNNRRRDEDDDERGGAGGFLRGIFD